MGMHKGKYMWGIYNLTIIHYILNILQMLLCTVVC